MSQQQTMFIPGASGAAPVTTEEICFDDEPVSVPVEAVSRPPESGGQAAEPAVPSPVQGQAEQLPGGISGGQLPGGGEQKQPEKGSRRGKGEPEQIALLTVPEPWEEHWKGMPHFKQENLMPWKSIYVHFECREDMEAFAKLVNQRVGLNTRFIWYPEAEIEKVAHMAWVDKEPEAPDTEEEMIETLDEG